MFEFIVLGTALLLAACSALFSITGIAQLFTSISVQAGVMAAALEIGKIVGVSALYRYRHAIPRTLKMYMYTGTAVLMLLTSVGVYGYLSGAYATAATGIQAKQNEITLYSGQQENITSNIKRLTDRSTQLQNMRSQQENRLDELVRLGRATATQQRIIREQDAEINKLQLDITRLSATSDSLSLLKTNTTNSIGTSGKLGTFYYVAEAIGTSLDTIVKWFILLLVLVLDPMSISLFLVYNIIVKKRDTITPTEPMMELPPPNEVRDEPVSIPEEPDPPKPESSIPYYMELDYDWKNDTRWHTDPNAMGYKSNLGVSDLDN